MLPQQPNLPHCTWFPLSAVVDSSYLSWTPKLDNPSQFGTFILPCCPAATNTHRLPSQPLSASRAVTKTVAVQRTQLVYWVQLLVLPRSRQLRSVLKPSSEMWEFQPAKGNSFQAPRCYPLTEFFLFSEPRLILLSSSRPSVYLRTYPCLI